jgi:hypothetical protein
VIDATTLAIGASVVDLHSEIVVFDPLEQYNATPFIPRTYAPSKDVVILHGFTRFGHTNNVKTLITGLSGNDSELTTNYILGVTSGASTQCGIGAPPPPARPSLTLVIRFQVQCLYSQLLQFGS